MSVTRPSLSSKVIAVADPDRLGDRDLDPGDHVGDRVLGGEADDQPEHRGRGEDAGGQPLQLGELAQRDHRQDDEDDDEERGGAGCAAGSWSSGRPVRLPATWRPT